MVQALLATALERALSGARSDGDLQFVDLPALCLEEPPDKAYGDFSTNVAMVLAKQARMAPREVAARLKPRLEQASDLIERVDIAGPGFLNLYLKPDWLWDVLRRIDAEGTEFGRCDLGKGQRIQVEFVSANPTGPIGVVQGRAGAFGDAVARVLSLCGYDVKREYYVNDFLNQVNILGRSVDIRYRQLLGQSVELPEDSYQGEYVTDIAREILEADGDRYLSLPDDERVETFRDLSIKRMLEQQKEVLARFGLKFDCWFSERTLHESGKVQEALDELVRRGHTYEMDGALWFRSTALGDDKDRVLVRSNGMPTYLAGDIAYHLDKFARGFDHVIDIWGPDHHGHVIRTQAAMTALGLEGKLEILIHQIVRLLSGGELVSMSKRAGDIIPLEELVDEVGADAARFFFLMRSAEAHLDFDLDLAKKESSENPVYYVQYAHARICSILREAPKYLLGEVNVGPWEIIHSVDTQQDPVDGWVRLLLKKAQDVRLEHLSTDGDKDLIRRLSEYPEEVRMAAVGREPHRLTRYAMDLASSFHAFYRDCRVLGDDPDLTAARLTLVNCARVVLRNTLKVLGISAPERM
ncbi:MAG TPA: arginine--tRNA ligase [Armatimonadota bacterium]|jgi:arginyl-tRNA synthetase